MNITVPIYQNKTGRQLDWVTVGLGPFTQSLSGGSALKIQQAMTDRLSRIIEQLEPSSMPAFSMSRGLRLERPHLTLALKGEGGRRKVSGAFPVIVEPMWANNETQLVLGYHPARQHEWFPIHKDASLTEQAERFFQNAWRNLDNAQLEQLKTKNKDQLRAIAFNAQPKSLLDKLPDRKKGLWDDLKVDRIKGQENEHRRGGLQEIPKIATNVTAKIAAEALATGMPREPYRTRLQRLLCGSKKRPTVLIGPRGCGKSTLIHTLIADLLSSDDFASHRNLDKVWSVWRLSGRRIIAGMSYLGDWENRCAKILADAKRKKVILWIEDLGAWGQIGRSRDSDRNLASFFRGPISRGELLIVAECTSEQFQRLEDDSPSFASAFARIRVEATTPSETLRMMIGESRRLESEHNVIFNPMALRTILETTGSLLSSSAFPGKALDVLRRLAREGEARQNGERPDPSKWMDPSVALGPPEVIRALSERTGLPEVLLQDNATLSREKVLEDFGHQVMGQPEAVGAVTDLILRIRAGLTDPKRPYGVFLFTGPTGTGKTELARTLANWLYSDPGRLVRLDMSEYSHPDAAARLIGDRFHPEGVLTRRVREQPFCVVLFDEIEKAHPRLLGLLLQLFDEGRLTDASGQTADFTHTVIITTSNLGARTRAPAGFAEAPEGIMQDIDRAVRDFFAPELFNRIDQVVPFRPLSRPVAEIIANKELGRLLSRRGLTDRHIFVYANDAVMGSIVDNGFSQSEGARSLKRHLDQTIGALLTEHIAANPRATMQVCRLFESKGDLRLHAEPLTEAEPPDEEYKLAVLLERPMDEIQAMLPQVSSFLEDMESSDELKALSKEIRHHLKLHNLGHTEHADAIYNLDSMRLQLRQFKERVDALIDAQIDHEPEMIEAMLFSTLDLGKAEWERRPHIVHLFDRRAMAPPTIRLERSELLACLAEVAFLKRALGKVRDPSQHAIFIELMRIGHGRRASARVSRPSGLMEALLWSYADHRGEVEACAGRRADGTRVTESFQALYSARPDFAVIKIVGLCVMDIFEGEQGCHILHTLHSGPDVIRVRVLPAPPEQSPSELIDSHETASLRFQQAIESNASSLPPNPERTLPAVRRMQMDAPRGEHSMVEVEDFSLGYTTTARVKHLSELLERLWLLRLGG